MLCSAENCVCLTVTCGYHLHQEEKSGFSLVFKLHVFYLIAISFSLPYLSSAELNSVPKDSLFPCLILTFKVTESRFDRDSAGSEVEEEEVGEGSPQSNAMTEGDYVPDSPASSPIELKQELPKYLPALQVGDHLKDAWKCSLQMGFIKMGNVFAVAFMRELMGWMCLVDSLLLTPVCEICTSLG